jgi:uncharacterized hydrophobic protein (TIGR00271 family)
MSGPEAKSTPSTTVNQTASHFQDYHGKLLTTGYHYDLGRLLSLESLRGFAAIVVAIFVMRAPGQSPRAFAILVGIIFVAWAVGGISRIIDPRRRNAASILEVLFLGLGGASLLFFGDFTGEVLGRILGAILVGIGALNAAQAFLAPKGGARFEALLSGALYAALGAALLIAPGPMLGMAVLVLSVYWFLTGVITIATNIRRDHQPGASTAAWPMFLEWVQSRPNTADDRQQLYDKIFYEGNEQSRRLSRFFTLMGFATAIASFGIISDSTAVVIGAMLVAPLMTPLMGTSLAMSMGWPRRAMMSGCVALAGIIFAVGLGAIFGLMYGPDISPVSNSQVASRIAPTLVDLMIAIAAGGAGAFALSRPDVSDSLPGVAVAIALVPPLSVVGLMLSQGSWGPASGAMLLFLTNLVAILLVGAVVFVLTGVVPVWQMAQTANWRFRGLGMVAVLAIAVVAVLGVSGQTFTRQTEGLAKASAIVDSWLSGTDLVADSREYSDGTYHVVVSGSSQPPPVEELAADIEREFGQSVPVEVTWVPTATYTSEP